MSVTGITGVRPVAAIDAFRAPETKGASVQQRDPAAFFDMTDWTRAPGETRVTLGAAQAGPGDLAALSADVLAAILR